MRKNAFRIPDHHPSRPLLTWCLLLLKQCTVPAGAAPHVLSPTAIRNRLQAISEPVLHEVFGLKPIVPMVASPELLFNLRHVLDRLIEAFDLVSADAKFPWHDVASLTFPEGIEAFELPWRIREQARLLTGYYTPVPWSHVLEPIDGHFVHMSLENPMLVAYTRNDSKGEQDLQTPMKPGRYLAQFYPSLAPHTVRDLQSGILRDAELKFAVTADEIEDIYVRGPSSCMSHEASFFDGPCHPVRVYGDSDIQLAYVTGSHDRPTARSLVWPATKSHSRIYGDECLLTHLLEAAGYERHSLKGARIRRIPGEEDNESNFVLPYLDDARSFDIIDEQWLRIGGDLDGTSTNGLAYSKEEPSCAFCEEYVRETYPVGGEMWCDNCRDNDAFCSDFSGDYFSQVCEYEVVVRRKNGVNHIESWSESECDEHATFCDGSSQHYRTDTFEFVKVKGATWVAWYFEEHGEPDEDASDIVASVDNDNLARGERDAA